MNTLDPLLEYSPLGLALKARNAVFDTVFYDVSSLTFDEWTKLNPLADRKGTIIVVSPTGSSRKDSIRSYASAAAFYNSPDWESVGSLVVTGVGSSVVGTAALARNVADACKDTIGGDVAGVVSGLGASDVVQEGLGGYFFYGMLNQDRFLYETTLDNVSAVISDSFAKGTDIRAKVASIFGQAMGNYVPIGADVSSLVKILSARYLHMKNSKIRLLIGHSKGNLLIADALNSISADMKPVTHDCFQNLAVVTLGAVVDIAEDMIPRDRQYQFLGAFDSLGFINSRWTQEGLAPHTSLPGRWHSLNRKLPLHTDVFDVLQHDVTIPPPPTTQLGPDGKDIVGITRANLFEAALGTVTQNTPASVHWT